MCDAGTMAAQKSWIGKSEGTLVTFDVANSASGASFDAFTTRVDTLYGVTYVVLAPEHTLVPSLTTPNQQEVVSEYLKAIEGLSDLDRTAGSKTRHGPQGVFLGSFATHPLTGEKIPIFVADYVIGGYGTSAVMAVPAHDTRDYEFAKKYGLPIKQVIGSSGRHDDGTGDGGGILPYCDEGVLINCPQHVNSLSSLQAREVIVESLSAVNKGRRSISYKLRDWVFSRQRFWGEPIPIYYPVDMHNATDTGAQEADPRTGAAHTIRYDQPLPVPEEELPLELPEMEDFSPGNDPQGCLARATEWRYFERNGKWFARETNTMPQVRS
jgi:leucyl-tRNA synthetase